jgi:prolyl oligopeptidase
MRKSLQRAPAPDVMQETLGSRAMHKISSNRSNLSLQNHLIAGLLIALTACSSQSVQPISGNGSAKTMSIASPALAKAGNVVDEHFGVRIPDPYRSLENLDSAETQTWLKSQASYTREVLDRIPGRQKLLDRITALDATQNAQISSLQQTNTGQLFYLIRSPGESTARLVMREQLDAVERTIIDPAELKAKTGIAHTINNFSVSPDGSKVAAVISKADAELGDMHVLDTKTLQPLTKPIVSIWGELSAIWMPDSQSLFYPRSAHASEPGKVKFGKFQVFHRRLGNDVQDQMIVGWHASPLPDKPQVRERDWVYMSLVPASEYTVVGLFEGIGTDGRLLVAKLDSLASSQPMRLKWSEMAGTEAGIRGYDQFGSYLYVRTHQQAPRFRILRYDLAKPEQAPVEVVPQQSGVIEATTVASDGLYYTLREGAVSTLYRMPHGGDAGATRAPDRVALPYAGAVKLFDASPKVAGVFFELEGWTQPLKIFNTTGTQIKETSLLGNIDTTTAADRVSEEVHCASHDGVEVPMSILYRKGLKRDGSAPTIMNGYGGYGRTTTANYSPVLNAWFERGGIYVYVNPRGSGAYGHEWYQAAVGATKSNTWKDMIACAQTLIDKGYTSSGKLAIQGTSMGGVAAGMAIVERPDLFAVGLLRVGILDTVRFIEATNNGPNHELEMGAMTSLQGINQLLRMSTYHNIKEGERYPALYFTAGMNDNRVAPWLPMKTAAKFQAAGNSLSRARPTLLRVEFEGGHGLSGATEQRFAETADRFSYVLWQTGAKDFQLQ